MFNLKLLIKEQKHDRKKKRTELKYKNETHSIVTNESTVIVQKEKNLIQI